MIDDIDIEAARSVMFQAGAPDPERTAHARARLLSACSAEHRPQGWRMLRTPKRLMLIGATALCVSAGAAAATGVFVNANTHTYNHGWQHVAGGPGENITGAGTNFVKVVRTESAGAGIVFPATYSAWRTSWIERNRTELCRAGSSRDGRDRCAQESTGMLNVNLAQDAFCTWVLQWRHAKLTRNTSEAHQAARVIAQALSWKAVTDVEYIQGMYSQSFAWMRPFMQAVAAGSVQRVNNLIAQQDGWFSFYDPKFEPMFAKRLRRTPPGPRQAALVNSEGSIYLHYLQHGGS
jgi:hypothetical protein